MWQCCYDYMMGVCCKLGGGGGTGGLSWQFIVISVCVFCMLSYVQEESKEFVTMSNLEQKIQEAIDNELNLNYALTKTGKKIYSSPSL